jgi:hypothetical protein
VGAAARADAAGPDGRVAGGGTFVGAAVAGVGFASRPAVEGAAGGAATDAEPLGAGSPALASGAGATGRPGAVFATDGTMAVASEALEVG